MKEDSGKTLVELTTDRIIDYITTRQLQPGDKVPTEAEFLEKFSVSRGTLREAFKILIARNILESRQGAGTFISSRQGIPDDPLGLTFIYDDQMLALDMIDLRLMIEPKSAQLAAVNATDEQKQALIDIMNELENRIHNGESYVDLDGKFHQLIAESTGNKVIGNLTYILFSSIEKNIELTLNSLSVSNTLFYHRRILNAILNGNIFEAYNFMTNHLSLIREYMYEKMSENKD
ncbi:MAG: FadR family transcriptional regulator [Anaerovibrio sp.]|uniref:FadR/GntR family transcriptional regulator n=1 Tax=Anaerovibrio sp. TaxID=1872532 RepID=UPI0025E04BAD|nr:FadR/GntR family transcriptional regulator [Anaerovibrio sp.]MCR5177159.1 FadR family transcriptional regulator [Anaerovibrio sp.]